MTQASDDDGATRSLAPDIAEPAPRPALAAPAPDDVVRDEPERYLLESQIGAGGMGVVVAARGERLGRRVAVKMISSDREDLLARFDREARFTARLQHPAIVPVYGTGRNRDGRPFYAMKHVTGRPLDKVIAATTTLDQRIALLPHVIAVSEALAYAHAERVIHRDLKPANILVGTFGETVVIDWGLAKELDTPDPEVPDATGPYRHGASTSDGTALGKVLGTPAFMPIEQARGEPVDERADVYALGAILYNVLSGRPPFTRADEGSVPWESVLARVLSSTPEPLAELQPGVPPDLVAIVARAMAKSAADRYPSAGELAADLKRFQTGQLVGAHQYSTWQLVRRWVRRNRIAVTVATIALLVLGVGAYVSVSRILREEAIAEEQRAAAIASREVAVKSRDDAETLMSFMLGSLRDKLQPLGKLDILDEVAKKAIDYYAPKDTSALTDAELANRSHALRNLGDVLKAQGHADQALVQYQAALALAERTGGAAADDADHLEARALSHQKVGEIEIAQAKHAEAVAEMRTVLELETRIAGPSPSGDRLRGVGNAHELLGEALYASGDRAGALAEYHTWIDTAGKLVAGDPANEHWQRDLALGHSRLGDALDEMGRYDEALVEDNAALALGTGLLARQPDDASRIKDIAVQHQKVGDVHLNKRDATSALASYRASMTATARLAERDPTNAETQTSLAIAHTKIGDVFRFQNNGTAALAEYELAVKVQAPIVERDASSAGAKRVLAASYERAGMVNLALAKLDASLAALAAATDIREKLATENPSSQNEQRSLERSLGEMMSVSQARGDKAGAVAAVTRELDIATHVLTLAPGDVSLQMDIVTAHSDFGALLQAQGDLPGSVAEHRRALVALEPIIAKEPNNLDRAELAAGEHRFIAVALMLDKHLPDALVEVNAYCAICEKNLATQPANLHYRATIVACHENRADVQFYDGKLADAERELRTAYAKAVDILALDPANADGLYLVKELTSKLAECCNVHVAPPPSAVAK